jgi:DNA-binding beta-propeller fold protein YncE
MIGSLLFFLSILTSLSLSVSLILSLRSKANLSKVLVFGGCDQYGGRTFIKTVTTGTKNPGVNHPYGITFDQMGNIYVSFQHTNTVLRFKKDTFEPMSYLDHFMKYLSKKSHEDMTPYPGTFYQYPLGMEGIRDIAFVEGYLWIANEDLKGISVVDSTGTEIHRIHMRDHAKPIGLYYDEEVGLVFVTSRSSYGAVYGINPISREVRTISFSVSLSVSLSNSLSNSLSLSLSLTVSLTLSLTLSVSIYLSLCLSLSLSLCLSLCLSLSLSLCVS